MPLPLKVYSKLLKSPQRLVGMNLGVGALESVVGIVPKFE